MASKKTNLEKDFSDLARIALTGRPQDVHVLIQRAAKRYKEEAPELADKLLELLRESPTRSSPLRKQMSRSVPVDMDSRLHLIKVEEKPVLDHDPVFAESIQSKLHRLVEERARAEALVKAGIDPTRSVLLTGPPGVGKTMAARWLAIQLDRPLIVLDLAAVMSSYLGRTGSNLRQVLDFAKSVECVLLLDELDAIAKRRDDTGEVGELKRLVTVLIQEIDDWPAAGLLLAATNHAELLDPAIWRRFEEKVEFPLPGAEARKLFISARLSGQDVDRAVWAKLLAAATRHSSFSDLELSLRNARREAVLNGGNLSPHLLKLIHPESLNKAERIQLAAELVFSGALSQRAAHELTGVARETIRSRVNAMKEDASNAGA